jgi:hypothetical protein
MSGIRHKFCLSHTSSILSRVPGPKKRVHVHTLLPVEAEALAIPLESLRGCHHSWGSSSHTIVARLLCRRGEISFRFALLASGFSRHQLGD